MSDAASRDAVTRLTFALADRYHIEREIGAGGMATVYLAHDRRHDRDVAIKVLRPELAESLGRERFVREIRLAARLSHPHILPLYDSGEAGGHLYYVMPVMEGQTLRQRLDAETQLSIEDAVRIATEVADALDYAHRHDIVHRDIKPENILLHEGHALVADFGLGKAVAAAAAEPGGITQVGIAMGTPAYMSPEQAAGDAVDGRSDLFALGCMLYEMLTGEQPFIGPTAQAVIAKRFHHVPPAVTTSRPAVPERVSRTVERLLEKAPDDRLASGATVVSALRGELALAARRETPSIAVLPFANMSADADNVFFSDGITDDIIGALTRVPGLKVAARASAFTFRGTDVDLAVVGERLGVCHVLHGSVRRAGNRVRVAVQLMAAQDGTQRWSERFDRDLDDIFAIQDEIARAIVQELEVVLGLRAEDTPLVVKPTDDLEAYELYLRGREAIRVRTPTSLQRGRDLFEQALQRDRKFARAWLGLAEAYIASGTYGYESPGLSRRQAEQALAEAASLTGSDAEVALHRAFIKLYMGDDWPTAGADLEVALAGRPNDALGHCLLAGWHGLLGNGAGRAAAAMRAVEADPLSPFTHSICAHSYYYTDDFHDALEYHGRALALDANHLNATWGAALCHDRLGQSAEAVRLMRRAVEISEGSPAMISLLAHVLFGAGEVAEAIVVADDLSARFPDHPYCDLLATVRRGDEERLARALDAAVEHEVGNITLTTTIKQDLDLLLAHPRLGPAVRRLNLYAQMPGLMPLTGGARPVD